MSAGDPRRVAVPPDLLLVLAVVAVAVLSPLVPGLRTSPVRAVAGLALALFVPGYALLAALFPAGRDDDSRAGTGPGPVERVGYAVGLSSVASIGIGFLAAGTVGLSAPGVIAPLAGLALVGVGVAVRRGHDPLERAAAVEDGGRAAGDVEAGERGPDGGGENPDDGPGTVGWIPGSRAVTALVLAVLVAAVVASVALLAAPMPHQGYTELYVLGEDTAGPDAGSHPRTFTAGDPRPLVVGIENHHADRRSYTVVVAVQRVRVASGSNGSASADGSDVVEVLDERELERVEATVRPGGRWTRQLEVAPTLTGRVRIAVRLYRGDAGDEPRYQLHLWVDVTGGENASVATPRPAVREVDRA